ncbi:MAG: ATP-binding protein [Candidatus Omnitrophota bacterium]
MKNLNQKIFIAFSLISVIPILVFAYLILPNLLPIATYVRPVPLILFITAIIVILGFIILIGISKNIAKLSMSANMLVKGDYTQHAQVKGNDEIAGLSNSLNQITNRLRSDINDLESRAILVERVNKELSRLNELKSDFVTMVSHELRAPLINIKQAAFLLLSGLTGQVNSEQERSLQIVQRSSERLLKLIKDLLDISKIEAGELELNWQMLDIGKLMQDAAESLERWSEVKKIKISLEANPNLPDAFGDPDRVNQVLVNLLSNAIKFTPPGGEIIIKTELAGEGDFLEVSVRDTGAGIPLEQQDNIFNRFKQAGGPSARMQGIGLGLSITREIIKMHGAKIWVESKQGQGSKFIFTLPKFSPAKVKEESWAGDKEARIKKKIMIVDDEVIIVETLKKLFKKLGYHDFTEAYDGDEALLKLNSSIPDLIMLDMKMPRMSGYDLIGRIKENNRTKDISIIIISGYEVEKDRLKGYIDKEFFPMLNKPVNIQQLKDVVDSLL